MNSPPWILATASLKDVPWPVAVIFILAAFLLLGWKENLKYSIVPTILLQLFLMFSVTESTTENDEFNCS
jgi:hypothetical protein